MHKASTGDSAEHHVDVLDATEVLEAIIGDVHAARHVEVLDALEVLHVVIRKLLDVLLRKHKG